MEVENKTVETSEEAAGKVDQAAEQVGGTEPDNKETESDAERETNDAEFEEPGGDGDRAQPQNHQEEKRPPQSRERNAEEARKRREAEKNEAVKRAKVEAVIEATGGVNPYTGAEIQDADDVEEYLNMKRIEKNGGDPKSDYSEYIKKRAREQRAEQQAAAEKQANIKKDLEDFHEKFPTVDASELLKNEDFVDYADGKLGRKSLADIYDGYSSRIGKIRKSEAGKAAQAVANSRATPGSVATPGNPEVNFFSRDQVKSMTSEERRANYDIIRKSMDKW